MWGKNHFGFWGAEDDLKSVVVVPVHAPKKRIQRRSSLFISRCAAMNFICLELETAAVAHHDNLNAIADGHQDGQLMWVLSFFMYLSCIFSTHLSDVKILFCFIAPGREAVALMAGPTMVRLKIFLWSVLVSSPFLIKKWLAQLRWRERTAGINARMWQWRRVQRTTQDRH